MESGYVYGIARHNDAEGWMELVDIVKENFPGLIIEEYKEVLLRNIVKQSALCVKYDNEIVGVLLYSAEQKTLSCMAVHPAHRKKGIASALVMKMIENFPRHSKIWVTTFREGDPKGSAARALYKKIGFIEDELILGFDDYPVQKFVLYT